MAGEPNDSRSGQSFDRERLKELLTCGTLYEERETLRWSSNYTFLVTVADDKHRIPAVYKPQRGERPLWDFPDGTLCYRECAAFVVSDWLGWELVPPTVLRDGPRGIGSVQLFVPHNPDVNYFSLDERSFPQLMRLAAFDYIINNADRKGGHCLLDSKGHLWGIDHGIAFHSAPKMRTVIWDFAGQKVPEPYIADLQRLSGDLENAQSRLRIEMDKLLNEAEVGAFQTRVRRLIQRREYPRPGPGPNYPWPPV
jgi:hypothetical protein